MKSFYKIDHHLYNDGCDQCANLNQNNYFIDLIDALGLQPFIPGLPGAPPDRG